MSGQNTNHHRLGCEPDSLVPLDCIEEILSIHHEVPTGFKTGQDYCQLVSLWTTALPFTNHRQTKLHCQSEKNAPFTAPFTVRSPSVHRPFTAPFTVRSPPHSPSIHRPFTVHSPSIHRPFTAPFTVHSPSIHRPIHRPFTVHSPPHSWNPFPFRVIQARVFPLAIECAHSPSLRKGTPLPKHKNQDHPLHGRRFVYLFESPPQHS